ncbi:MAG: TIGR03943 family putative permease subunit [Anaerolineae bacterium]
MQKQELKIQNPKSKIQNPRAQTVLKTALLAGLALMLYSKFSNGTLTFYINQRFAWLVFVGVLILAALALTIVYQLMEQRAGMGQGSAGRGHRLSWPAVILVSIPILMGVLVPAQPLGASAIASRGIGLSAPGAAGGNAVVAQRVATGPKNILDWLRAFSRQSDPAAFVGQEVDVIGFVYRDPRNASNQFWVSRFVVSCCVADASAIGLLVQADQASTLTLDSWVRVTGRLGLGEFAGERLPVIVPDTIEPTGQPEHPYLYP